MAAELLHELSLSLGKFSPANNITHMNDIEHYRINKTYLSISWPGGVITVLPVPASIPAAGGTMHHSVGLLKDAWLANRCDWSREKITEQLYN